MEHPTLMNDTPPFIKLDMNFYIAQIYFRFIQLAIGMSYGIAFYLLAIHLPKGWLVGTLIGFRFQTNDYFWRLNLCLLFISFFLTVYSKEGMLMAHLDKPVHLQLMS